MATNEELERELSALQWRLYPLDVCGLDTGTMVILPGNHILAEMQKAVHQAIYRRVVDYDMPAPAKAAWWSFWNDSNQRLKQLVRLPNGAAIKDSWNCSSWAVHCWDRAKMWLVNGACGVVTGNREGLNHAYNWCMDFECRLWFHEPNPWFLDELLMWGPGSNPRYPSDKIWEFWL